jgi:hypothetical protein
LSLILRLLNGQLRLVTLQTVVTDTQHSLDEVVNSIERNILSDGVVSAVSGFVVLSCLTGLKSPRHVP